MSDGLVRVRIWRYPYEFTKQDFDQFAGQCPGSFGFPTRTQAGSSGRRQCRAGLDFRQYNSAQLGYGTAELKVEPVTSGTYTDGTLSVTITVRETAEGQVTPTSQPIWGLTLCSSRAIADGNLYIYNPRWRPTPVLHAPTRPSQWAITDQSTHTPRVRAADVPTHAVPPTLTATRRPTHRSRQRRRRPDVRRTLLPRPPTKTPTSTPQRAGAAHADVYTNPYLHVRRRLMRGCTPGYWKQDQRLRLMDELHARHLGPEVFATPGSTTTSTARVVPIRCSCAELQGW